MTALSEAQLLDMYKAYLQERGFSSTKIAEVASKTPDLELSRGSRGYLNEFKSPELILDESTQMYKFKTTNSKLLRFIHEAINQLKSHDPTHAKPWIVTFASCHFQLNWTNFADALRGGMVLHDGTLIPPGFQQTHVFKMSLKDRFIPDLYIWLQVSPELLKLYQVMFLVNDKSAKKPLIEELVQELSSIALSDMDLRLLLL